MVENLGRGREILTNVLLHVLGGHCDYEVVTKRVYQKFEEDYRRLSLGGLAGDGNWTKKGY